VLDVDQNAAGMWLVNLIVFELEVVAAANVHQ